MRYFLAFVLVLFQILFLAAAPTREEILKQMAVPSTDSVRGQKDGIGYAKTKEQMEEIYNLSLEPPSPNIFGEEPSSSAFCVIVPHDDYLYAGRVYRQLIPMIKAKTVFIIGPLHRWRDFEIKNKIVLDGYSTWRTPDGEVKVSKIRDIIVKGLPEDKFIQNNTAFDSEHSIEGPLYFLKHSNKDVEIVPILVPPMDYQIMMEIMDELVTAVGTYMEFNNIYVGEDIAFIISADAVHYGKDFNYTPYGDGGCEAYQKAVEEDKSIILNLLSKSVTPIRVKAIFERFQDLYSPEKSNITWCGRFSIPFGLSLGFNLFKVMNARTSRAKAFYGYPLCYSTSVGAPAIQSKTGLGTTAPSNLYHFVGYPGVYYKEAIVNPIEQLREIPKNP
ncbi:MAG: AmmeMemoRadiSam system protein B [Acidobacteria bacterium]|nr:AmmeMemoRadiSam system protein B [Acidobacteriota bacterium]